MSHSKLQEILKKWRNLALKKAHSSSDQAGGRRVGASITQVRRSISMPNPSSGSRRAGAEGGSSRGASGRVPAGHLAVYVGEERRRFVIKTWYLSHPLFRALLKKTEEEIGFRQEGALAIPCPVFCFEHILRIIGDCKSHHHNVTTTSLSRPQESSTLQTAAGDDQQLHEELLLQLLHFSSDQLGCHYALSRPSQHHEAFGISSCNFYKPSLSGRASQAAPVVV